MKSILKLPLQILKAYFYLMMLPVQLILWLVFGISRVLTYVCLYSYIWFPILFLAYLFIEGEGDQLHWLYIIFVTGLVGACGSVLILIFGMLCSKVEYGLSNRFK